MSRCTCPERLLRRQHSRPSGRRQLTACSWRSTPSGRWKGSGSLVTVRRCGGVSTTERSPSRTRKPSNGMDSPRADSETLWMSLSGLVSSTSHTVAMVCTRTRRSTRSAAGGNGTGLRSSCHRNGQSGRRGWDSRKGISMARTRAPRIHSCCAQQLTTVAGNSWGEIEAAFSSQRTRVAGMPSTVVHNSALKTPPGAVELWGPGRSVAIPVTGRSESRTQRKVDRRKWNELQ